MKKFLFMDLEVYPNYTLIGLMDEDQKVFQISQTIDKNFSTKDIAIIKKTIRGKEIVTYNGNNYDIPILIGLLENRMNTNAVYEFSKEIIENSNLYNACKIYNINRWEYKNLFNSVDLVEVQPNPKTTLPPTKDRPYSISFNTSLKVLGTRLHSKKLQELPIDPHNSLSKDDMINIAKYNINDLIVTQDLFVSLKKEIELRYNWLHDWHLNVLSKSDAQMAEVLFSKKIEEVTGIKPKPQSIPKYVKYNPPKPLMDHTFKNEKLQEIFTLCKNEKILVNQKSGHLIAPNFLKTRIGKSKRFKGITVTINNTEYTLGLGGLHSVDNQLVQYSIENSKCRNADVAGYYPSMMIEYGFYPKSVEGFLPVFEEIKDDRLKAKVEDPKGTIDRAYKIVLNGTFGKLGSKFSIFYSPETLLHVTLTGQFMMLMLIEELENIEGVNIYSANTDGIEYKTKDDKKLLPIVNKILQNWQDKTGMVLEFETYDAIYARDVNNYFTVKNNKPYKKNGMFKSANLKKGVKYEICYKAVMNYLADNISIEDTIYNAIDIRDFIIAQSVNTGAYYNNEYIGKLVRFYYGTNNKNTLKNSKGGKVPNSENCVLAMDLPKNIPNDLDYDKYCEIAKDIITDLGMSEFDI